MIADTNFVIDVMAKDPVAVKKAREIEEAGLRIMVGSPTVFELFAGVALSRKAEEEKIKIMTILSSLPQLSLDFPSGRDGGMIYGEKMKMGRTIDPEDAMLAGIARVKAEKILTRNVKHFSDINGVIIETY
ncbi:MAG TPA: PIN domain-containing protein [Candidatus Bathyarchaeia archaeon]|nr:PIN domain-containing protein [Candidatus Bathyarchaeia archaeon]